MKTNFRRAWTIVALGVAICQWPAACPAQTVGYRVWVSNEKSGNLTVIDPDSRRAVATIPVGKRPRGLRVSPDASTVFVAVSGTPIAPPPKLDARGNPIFERGKADDDDDEAKGDKAADGIALVDVGRQTFLRKMSIGSDPEQLAISADGQRLYVSNEDVGTASVMNIASGRVEHIIPVHREPEGVTTSPDGKVFVVTCESDGEIFVVDTATFKVVHHFNVGGRPRSADFLPDGSRVFIPSESAGQLHVIDTANYTVLKTIPLPPGARPMCVKVAPDGKKVYVSTGRGGTVVVLDAQNHTVLNTIKVGARPWGLAVSPDGAMLFVANGPSNDISVVDLRAEKEIGRVKAGESPWGVVLVPAVK